MFQNIQPWMVVALLVCGLTAYFLFRKRLAAAKKPAKFTGYTPPKDWLFAHGLIAEEKDRMQSAYSAVRRADRSGLQTSTLESGFRLYLWNTFLTTYKVQPGETRDGLTVERCDELAAEAAADIDAIISAARAQYA